MAERMREIEESSVSLGDIVAALTAAGFRPRHDPPLRVIDGQGIVQFTFQPAGAGRAGSPTRGRRT